MSTVGRVTTSNDSNNTIAVACLALLVCFLVSLYWTSNLNVWEDVRHPLER
jgi:ABC-type multidrug transport system permease subunit